MRSQLDPDLLHRLSEDGHNTASAAREMGVSRTTITRAEQTHGIRFARSTVEGRLYRSHRERVADMKPLEAVDYLLNVVEMMVEAEKPALGLWILAGVRLTRAERNMFYALAKARGRVLSKDTLLTSIMTGREGDDEPAIKIVDVYACKIREKIKDQPYRLITHWGLGYSIEAPSGHVWPWEGEV